MFVAERVLYIAGGSSRNGEKRAECTKLIRGTASLNNFPLPPSFCLTILLSLRPSSKFDRQLQKL